MTYRLSLNKLRPSIIILSFLIMKSSYSLTPENIKHNDIEKINVVIENHTKRHLNSLRHSTNENFQIISKDPRNLVDKTFKVSNYFLQPVNFWFYIYTTIGEDYSCIHDKNHTSLVYDVVDFTELKKSGIDKFTRSALQKQASRDRVSEVKKILLSLSQESNLKGKSKITESIIESIKESNLVIPESSKEKELFFKDLSQNIRSQLGQKSNVLRGIKNSLPYLDFINTMFRKMHVPKELISIAYLESSFNTNAHSKAGAVGVWQFMSRIGRHFLPIKKYYDLRKNPVISTIGAIHLLKHNKKILKRWDLAITAYNSGTKHIIKAQRKLKNKYSSLENIFTSYKHPHLGFASKNYYSELLALIHATAYKDEIYNELKDYRSELFFSKKPNIYITKCKIKPSEFYKKMKKYSPNIKLLNQHFRRSNKVYPKGSIIVSDRPLTKRKYLELTDEQITNIYPKNWTKLVKSYSCSTR